MFTRAQETACTTIGKEFLDAKLATTGQAWMDLAERIGFVLAGSSARFTNTDVALVSSLHNAGLRNGMTLERSRMLSQLGVAVLTYMRLGQ